jgi:hypothetical protein
MRRTAVTTPTIFLFAVLLGGAPSLGCSSEEIDAKTNISAGESRPVSGATPSERLRGAQHPGHFANKQIEKSTTPRPQSLGGQPLPVDPGLRARQVEYLRRWQAMQASLVRVPTDEREAQRAALKRSVVGN